MELNYPQAVKDSYFTVAGYANDGHNPNVFNSSRRSPYHNNDVVEYVHKLSADLFNQNLYMISNVEMDIEITPHTSQHFMLNWEDIVVPAAKEGEGAEEARIRGQIGTKKTNLSKNATHYQFKLVDIRLMVKTLDLMDGLNLDISRHLDTSSARYGIRRTKLKHLLIVANRTDFSANLFIDEVSRRVVIGLVENKYFLGTEEGSPFYFNHNNVRDIQLIASGRQYPQVPYNLDYDKNAYSRAYQDTQENLGFANALESNGINFSRFKTAMCIYVFQMTNSQEDTPGFELLKDGSTIININFAKKVPEGGLQLIAYAETDGLVNIDQNRMVTVGF